MARITELVVSDVRFPTSELLDGSDAMNPDPDYSAAYVEVRTDDPGLRGFGMTFTIGRGNELCCAAIEAFGPHLVGRALDDLEADLGSIATALTSDSQMRWLGPEKGVVHLATAALVNAQWDLLSRRAGLPLWKYLAGLTAEQVVSAVDFRHISDALSPTDAHRAARAPSIQARPSARPTSSPRATPPTSPRPGGSATTTTASAPAVRAALADGWSALKMKVGRDRDDDLRRAAPRPGADRAGPAPHGGRQPGVGRRAKPSSGRTRSRRPTSTGSRSRRAPTTSSATLGSGPASLRCGSPPASTATTG